MTDQQPTIQTSNYTLSELIARRHHRNPKEHKLDGIIASLRRFGFVVPPMLDTTSGVLVAGHGRCEALQRMKDAGEDPPGRIVRSADDWIVPAFSTAFADDEERDAYVIADNRLTEVGGWNDERLHDMLATFKRPNLESMGFTRRSYDALMSRFKPQRSDAEVATPEAPSDPITQLGDVWELDGHRVICADCTTVDPSQLVLGSTGFALTSPPYNAGASKGGSKFRLDANTTSMDKYGDDVDDTLDVEAYEQLLHGSLRVMLGSCAIACVNLQSIAGNKVPVARWLGAHADHLVDRIVWDKGAGRPSMWANVLNSAFEDLYLFSSQALPKRNIVTADFYGTVSNIYRGGQQTENEYSDVHNATMPLHLARFALGDLAFRADFVVDPFGGTGTTLVAAHELGKRCATVERSPAYCDVIVERWQKLCGGHAKRV
jgi:DNA modification methylase